MNSNLLEKLAFELAKQYASGWREHANFVGEPKFSLTAEEWAKCNSHAFIEQANRIIESFETTVVEPEVGW